MPSSASNSWVRMRNEREQNACSRQISTSLREIGEYERQASKYRELMASLREFQQRVGQSLNDANEATKAKKRILERDIAGAGDLTSRMRTAKKYYEGEGRFLQEAEFAMAREFKVLMGSIESKLNEYGRIISEYEGRVNEARNDYASAKRQLDALEREARQYEQ